MGLVPRTYSWHSPVGIFEVAHHHWRAGSDQWQLSIHPDGFTWSPNSQNLRRYPDHIAAMQAVIRKDTGYLKWDGYAGSEEPPDDDRDWDPRG